MGESEKRARHALRLAEAIAPCVLWIDEMEKALSSGGNDGGTSTRVMGTLLTWMAEKTAPCFVVATANDISALPPELLRRGRFDEIFSLDLPTAAERAEILAVHIRLSGRDPVGYDLAAVAGMTDGFVGAEMAQTVHDGLIHAFDAGRDLTTTDLVWCAQRVVPLSVAQRERVAGLRAWLAEGGPNRRRVGADPVRFSHIEPYRFPRSRRRLDGVCSLVGVLGRGQPGLRHLPTG